MSAEWPYRWTATTAFVRGPICGRDGVHIDGCVLSIAVDEHGPRAKLQDRQDTCEKRIRRNDHLVAPRDTESFQRKVNRRRSRSHPHAAARAAVVRELFLEAGDLLPEDVLGRSDYGKHGLVDLLFDRPVLPVEIDKRNAHFDARPSCDVMPSVGETGRPACRTSQESS